MGVSGALRWVSVSGWGIILGEWGWVEHYSGGGGGGGVFLGGGGGGGGFFGGGGGGGALFDNAQR